MAPPLPMRATLAGVDVVIVSAAEYGRLSANQNVAPGSDPSGVPTPGWPVDRILDWMRSRRGQSSPILFDQEVSRFIVEGSATMTQAEVLMRGIDRFGEDRMPSGSALNRFVKGVRKYLEAHPEVFK